MKRKILSYLLVWLFALFIGGYCFTYVDAGEGQQYRFGVDSDGSNDSNDSDSNDSSSAGSKVKDMAIDGGSNGGGRSTTTTTSSPSSTQTESNCSNGCCGIKLNTNFPIIGNCIRIKGEGSINPTNAFPYMVGILTKIVMSVILVVCFILVIVAGIMRAGDNPKGAQKLLKRVAITIILLGFSGVILKLLNPNFFG